MKSIYEKTEETYPKTSATSDLCNEKFVEGANYVLECFESILPFVAKKGIIYGKIKETIEQLKK